jgi:hypothetical protein
MRSNAVPLGLDIRSVHHKARPNALLFIDALAAAFPEVTQVSRRGRERGWDLPIDGSPFVTPLNGLYSTWQSQ